MTQHPTGRPPGRPPMDPSQRKQPIRLNLDPKIMDTLSQLAERTGKTRTQVIEQAITELAQKEQGE